MPNSEEPGLGGIDIDLVLRWVAEAATDPLPPFLSWPTLLEVAEKSGELVTSDAGRKFVAAGIEIEVGLAPFGLP